MRRFLRLSERLSERFPALFFRHTPGFFVWAALTLMLACAASLLLERLYFPAAQPLRNAFEAGQIAVLHLASGDIEGTVRHTSHEPPKTAALPEDAPPQNTAPGEVASGEGAPGGVTPGGDAELTSAPFSPLSEPSDKGLIPRTGQDGTLPWKYYARPHAAKAKRPMVAVLLTHLGLSKPLTEDVLALPRDFTLGFSPYAGDVKKWAMLARQKGFETLVDIPLQPEDYPVSDPGPYGFVDSLDSNEAGARLHWILSRFPGFVGVLGPPREKLTPNATAMRPLLTEIYARGLLFLYVKTPQNTALATAANSRAFNALGIDMVVDAEISRAAIDAQLEKLTALAKAQGSAIGLAHSYPPTTEALARWAETLSAQGVDLAPVSAIAAQALQ